MCGGADRKSLTIGFVTKLIRMMPLDMLRITQKNRKLFLSIFATYFALIAMMLAFYTASNIHSRRVVADYAQRLSRERLSKDSENISATLQGLIKTLDQLSSDEMLRTYASYSGDDLERFYHAYELQKVLLAAKTQGQFQRVIINFPKSSTILTDTQCYMDSTKTLFLKKLGLDSKIFEYLSSQGSYGMFFALPGECWISKVVPIGGQDILIILCFDLAGIVEDNGSASEAIVISDGTKILFSNLEVTEEEMSHFGTEQENRQYQNLGDNQYVTCSAKIPYGKWLLTIGYPVTVVMQDLHTFQQISILFMLLAVSVAALMAYVLTGRMYRPLAGLVKRVNIDADSQNMTRLLVAVDSNMQEMQSERRSFKQIEVMNKSVAAGGALTELRECSMENLASKAADIRTLLNIQATDTIYIAGVSCLLDSKNLFSSDNSQRSILQSELFVFQNVLSEMVGEAFRVSLALTDNYFAILMIPKNVSLSEKAENPTTEAPQGEKLHENGVPDSSELERLDQTLDHFNNFFRDKLGVWLALTHPNAATDDLSLREAVMNMQNQIQYRIFWKKYGFDDESQRKTLTSYYKETRKLIGALEAQNYKEANTIVESILNSTIPESGRDFRTAIYRIFGMISIIVSSLYEQEDVDTDFINQLDYEHRLYNVKNAEAFKQETEKILHELIEYKKSKKVNASPRLVKDAAAFIDENISDHNISVATVAAHFGITDSYLNKLFKTYMNYSVLEFIQARRIEKAKQLLATESIKDAAIQSGFWDA